MSLRAKVINAILTDATMITLIGDRLYWSGKATKTDTFPLLEYKVIDEIGQYSLGTKLEVEDVTYQIDIFTNAGDFDLVKGLKVDQITSRLKVIMNGIGFMQIGGAEDTDKEIQKQVKATRWVVNNVSDF